VLFRSQGDAAEVRYSTVRMVLSVDAQPSEDGNYGGITKDYTGL